jgi:hypothetical protein
MRLPMRERRPIFPFTIGNSSGETFGLTMDSGVVGVAAVIGVNSSGTPNNTIGVPVLLNSNLTIDLGAGTQRLVFSTAGSLDLGPAATSKNVTVTNGTSVNNQLTFNGNLTGAGTFTNNSNASVIISGAKDFTGVFVLNKGIGGSNTGSPHSYCRLDCKCIRGDYQRRHFRRHCAEWRHPARRG